MTPWGESTVNQSKAYDTTRSGTPEGWRAKRLKLSHMTMHLCVAGPPAVSLGACSGAAALLIMAALIVAIYTHRGYLYSLWLSTLSMAACSAGVVRRMERSNSASRPNESKFTRPTSAKPSAPPAACSTRPAQIGPSISHARSMLPIATLTAARRALFLSDQMGGVKIGGRVKGRLESGLESGLELGLESGLESRLESRAPPVGPNGGDPVLLDGDARDHRAEHLERPAADHRDEQPHGQAGGRCIRIAWRPARHQQPERAEGKAHAGALEADAPSDHELSFRAVHPAAAHRSEGKLPGFGRGIGYREPGTGYRVGWRLERVCGGPGRPTLSEKTDRPKIVGTARSPGLNSSSSSGVANCPRQSRWLGEGARH